MRTWAKLGRADVAAYTIPTDGPESDGTLEWNATTIVVVEMPGGGERGLGYTYADTATAELAEKKLAPLLEGRDAMDVPGSWGAMRRAIRNLGRPGMVSMAMAAMDAALWDLKAKLVGLPLAKLWGMVREEVPIYGSGGFTSYSIARLQEQLGGWAEAGMGAVKMKVGREPERDGERVAAARAAIGDGVELYVDANGAYGVKQALQMAERFAGEGASWFEEPVTSDDLAGLRQVRERAPAGMEIAAGEYGYELDYFRRMLAAEAVDVQQADATRCGGPSEFLRVGGLCAAQHRALSAHTAPALHLHLCCALEAAWNIEYFHDHVRIEEMLFEGTARPRRGKLRPELSRAGLGLELRKREARRFAA